MTRKKKSATDAVGEEGEDAAGAVGKEGEEAAGADDEQGDAVAEEGEQGDAVAEEGAAAEALEDDTESDDIESHEERDENQDKIIKEYARKLFAADDPRMNSFGTQLVSLSEEEKNFAMKEFKASNQATEKAFYTPLQWITANDTQLKQYCLRNSQYQLSQPLLTSIKQKLINTDQMPLKFLTQAAICKLASGFNTHKAIDVHLDLFFRLIPKEAHFMGICRKLFCYYQDSYEIPDRLGRQRNKPGYAYSETTITKLDFAELFLSCLYYFNIPLKKGTVNTWEFQNCKQDGWGNLALALRNNLVSTFKIASCENLSSDNLKSNYGLFVNIERSFEVENRIQKQIITLQLNDPINFTGLSLYYSEFCADTKRNSKEFVKNINKYARKCFFKSPEKSISSYLMTPEEQWQSVHKPLDTCEANKIVCDTPIQITKQMVEKHLAPSKWMSLDIVNWWLAYWCERLPENTFFTGEKSKSKSKRLTNKGSFVKEKILCVSSHFYQHIDRDFKHPENPSNNELDNLQIFKSVGILVPIHEENHWFLVHIRFNIARTKVNLHWYDSFVGITKASQLATTYDKQIQVISSYLQRRYLQFLGDAQTSESQLKITNVIGRLNEDQHGNSVECGVWTCMYASYVTLQLPVDLRASKDSGGKTHMIPVRTWMLKSMLNRGKKEVDEILRAEKIKDPERDSFINDLHADVNKESDLLQSYKKSLREINTALESYANKEQQFQEHYANIQKQTQGCKVYYPGLKVLNDIVIVKCTKKDETIEAEYNSIVGDISSINIETDALKWPKQQAEKLKQLVQKITSLEHEKSGIFKLEFDQLDEEYKQLQEYSQNVEQRMTQLKTNQETYDLIRDVTYPQLVNNLSERNSNLTLFQKALKQLTTDLKDQDKDSAQAIVDTFKQNETFVKFVNTKLLFDDLQLDLSKLKDEIHDLTENMGKIDSSNDDLNAKMEKLLESNGKLRPWLFQSQKGTAIMKQYTTILKQFALQCLNLEQEQVLLEKCCTDVDNTKELCKKQLQEINAEESKLVQFIKSMFVRTSTQAEAFKSARILFETLSQEIAKFFTTAEEVKVDLNVFFGTLQNYSTVAENMLDIGEKLSNFEISDVDISDPTSVTQNGANLMNTSNEFNNDRVKQVLDLKQSVDKTFASAKDALSHARKLQEPEEGNNAGTEAGEAGNEAGTAGTEPAEAEPDESKKFEKAIVKVTMDIHFQDISFDEQCKKLDMFLQTHKDEIADISNSTFEAHLGQLKQLRGLWKPAPSREGRSLIQWKNICTSRAEFLKSFGQQIQYIEQYVRVHQMPTPSPDTSLAATKLAEEQKANYEELLQKISVFEDEYTNTKTSYISFVMRKRDQVKMFALDDKIKETSEYNEIERIEPARLLCKSKYSDLQRTQEQLKDSAGTILRELRNTLEPDKINTLTQQLKEIVSNLDDNVLKCRETIDQFTKLTDRATELWNSIIKTMESSHPKDTNPPADGTAADQQAATSEEKMTLDLQNFLKNPDVTHLLDEGSLEEVIEIHKLIDDFYEKTKAIKKILQIYASKKIQVTLVNELQLVYNNYKVLRKQCRKFNEDADLKRSLAWVVLIRKELKKDLLPTSRVYRRWSKHQSQFFEKIQKIKDECKLIHESVTKFNHETTQEQLDGLVEALKNHLDDPPNGQEEQRQDQSSPDDIEELRKHFMSKAEEYSKTHPPFKSNTMKRLIELLNKTSQKVNPIVKKIEDYNFEQEQEQGGDELEKIIKLWENQYRGDLQLYKQYNEFKNTISLVIAYNTCDAILDAIEKIYNECKTSKADARTILEGIQAIKDYLVEETRLHDYLDQLSKFDQTFDDGWLRNMLNVIEHLHQLIEKHKSEESDRNGRKPSGGQQNGGQENGGQQNGAQPNGGQEGDQQHVDTDNEEEHEDGMGDYSIPPSSSPASSRSASPTPPHVYGRRVNPEHNGVLTYYLVELTGGAWTAEELRAKGVQTYLCGLFDVPSDSLDIRVDFKEQNLARYEIAPIALDAEITFTIWEHNARDFDVYYCGMYEPGERHDPNMKILKSPPELPDV